MLLLGVLAAQAEAAVAAGSYDLLQTEILTGSQASVTFSNLNSTYGSTYQHLQIRAVARTAQIGQTRGMAVQFNSDTGNNYSWHILGGDGSSVLSLSSASQSNIYAGQLSAASISSDIFAPSVIDILDPFSSSKNTTIRALSGDSTGTTPARIRLFSGAWYNTAALTSITLKGEDLTSDFVTGSRFSLYGLRSV